MEKSLSKSSSDSKTSPMSHAVSVSVSDEVVALTGHKQEIPQTMSFWVLLALCYSNMSVWTAIGGSLTSALLSGGPVVMVFGWFGVSCVTLMIAACLAELCSAWPHAAGQAFWAYRLAPSRWASLLSYWGAYFNIVGTWSILASGAWIMANEILGLATLFHPDYVQVPGHLVGVYLLLMVSYLLANVYAIRAFDSASRFSVGLSIVGSLAIIIALVAATPVKQSPKFVFTTFSNSTGWSSSGLVVLLGLLQSSFTMIGYDASAHLCEEAPDAARLGPLAIFYGVLVSAVVGLGYIITLLFCISDVDSVLGTATLVPLLQIYADSLGNKGATVCLLLNLICLYFAVVGILCASSRTVWSMSRDKGFPFHEIFSKVNDRYKVPVDALLLSTVVPVLLAMIYLGSTVIFFSFFQLTTIGYLVSYLVPIALAAVSPRSKLPQAPWRLPDWVARICQYVSIVYICFISVLFCVPNYYPVTASNMNYTSPILGVFIGIGLIGWYGFCRKSFKGPAADLHGENM